MPQLTIPICFQVSDGRHPSVDPGVVRLATPDAPADNSDLFPSLPRSNLHRSARVSAAGVLALLPGAHHVVHDAPGGGIAVGVLAGGVVPDLDGHLPQLVGLTALLLDAAPAHHSPGTTRVVVITVRQTHGPDVWGGLGDWVRHGDDGHVLVQGLLGEVLVSHHPGGLALEYLRLSFSLDQVVAQTDLQVGNIVPAHVSHTVSSREDVSVSDEGPTTELTTIVHQSRDPGPLSLVGRPAVHHLEGVLTVVVNPLLLLGHGPVAVVPDGVVLPSPTGGGVGGARSWGSRWRGGLVRHRDCSRPGPGGRNSWRGSSSSSSASSWVLTLGWGSTSWVLSASSRETSWESSSNTRPASTNSWVLSSSSSGILSSTSSRILSSSNSWPSSSSSAWPSSSSSAWPSSG